MRIERLEILGEHKRNLTAIYFKENPGAPDFRPLLGRRGPRGKGIRRVYKILMEHPDESEAQVCEQVREQAELAEPVPDYQVGEGSNQIIKVEKYKDTTILLNKVFYIFVIFCLHFISFVSG